MDHAVIGGEPDPSPVREEVREVLERGLQRPPGLAESRRFALLVRPDPPGRLIQRVVEPLRQTLRSAKSFAFPSR
jgi:hypothetical protein